MRFREHFEGKKITVMGLGLLGRGVGDARFLASQGAELIVTDLKSQEELASSLQELAQFPNITYVLGEHRLEDFRDRDYILKAAGVPLDSPYIAEARAAGIPIKMSASWFAELAQIPVIGVTGTRGKSTTTHMIHAILQEAGMPVLLGGNVRGVSTLALLDTVKDGDYALFELDSWQCQGFGDERMSPHIAVFTTFMQDHMNYYKDDMGKYFKDKANIFIYQKPEDVLVVSWEVKQEMDKYNLHTRGTLVQADMGDLRGWELKVPGNHNLHNAACARRAALALGVGEGAIRKALEEFTGVPGRLESLGEVRGITIYNDTNATTPDATLAALMAIAAVAGPARKLILIMGGADKGLNMDKLIKEIPTATDKVILLSGTGTERIKNQIHKRTEFAEDLSVAVKMAFAYAKEGDIILFSPGFASFGMFKNEYDRGDQFMSIIKSYGA